MCMEGEGACLHFYEMFDTENQPHKGTGTREAGHGIENKYMFGTIKQLQSRSKNNYR